MKTLKVLRFLAASCLPGCAVAAAAAAVAPAPADPANPALVKAGFIAEHPPFPSSHSSTIVEARDGILAAWFGGTRERATDVSVYLARYEGGAWTPPEEVANGRDEGRDRRYPCWNPVLFQRRDGDLFLFYKVGPSPESWWGMVKVSKDSGRTWSKAKRLPGSHVGPVRNKPVELPNGTLLCGASTEDAGWRIHMESTRNPLGGWDRTAHLSEAMEFGAIQPTILQHGDGRLQILCRTKAGMITECWSTNQGVAWSKMAPTWLPNPNSAIDSVMLFDGRALLVYNHSRQDRRVLNVAVSPDGKEWEAALVLEDAAGEYSYPAVIQTSDGLVHATYTWKRQRIKHVVIDPTKIISRKITEGRWPQ